ncbi:aspartate/glutamate racemase family protein [Bacillus cereus]
MQQNNKILGVIGGVGPETTAQLYKEIITRFFQRTKGTYPRLLIDNLPINNEIEKCFITSTVTPEIKKQTEEKLKECVRRLLQSGTNAIVLPCNTLHTVIEPIVKGDNVKFIHIVEETINEVVTRGYQRIGMICSNSTRYLNLYESASEQFNLDLIYPNTEEQIEVNYLITQILSGQCEKETLIPIFKRLEKDVDCIVLGCTDLWQIPSKGHIKVPIIDSLECLIEGCMDFYLKDKQEMIDDEQNFAFGSF